MLDLFILSHTEQNCTLTLKNESDIDIITQLLDVGEPLLKPIKTIKLKALASDKINSTRDLPTDDFPSFYGLTACFEAKNAIDPYINDAGEWIEMKLGSKSYYYFNVTLKLAALDVENTKYWVEDGYKIGVLKYAFKNLDYSKTPIFKLSDSPNHPAIVTSQLITMIDNLKLSGLSFITIL